MVRAWHGRGMVGVNQTRLHCVNQIGKTHSKPLAARHGRGMTQAQHGHGMLCVYGPLEVTINLLKPNDTYIRRTAGLTSRRYILNIYSTNIHTEYFKHAA